MHLEEFSYWYIYMIICRDISVSVPAASRLGKVLGPGSERIGSLFTIHNFYPH
jgi:hypothetical protein